MNIYPLSDLRTQARSWVLRMADADVGPEDQAAFRAWYDLSEENAAAYESELDLYYALEPLRPRFAPDPSPSVRRRWKGSALAGAGAAIAAALVLAVALPREPVHDWRAPLITRLGEIREITLPDGSRVTLGPETRVETAFTAQERRVRLSAGLAYFNVTHDAGRPFVVEAQGALVRDIGTEFEVKSGSGNLRVAVANGIVDVIEPMRLANIASGDRIHRLEAGQQVSITLTALAVEARAGHAPARPAAWRDGFLIYENATLAEVVADANSYSQTPIVIADPALGRLRVTTAYRTDQINRMLSIVGATMPITVVNDKREIRLVAKPQK